VQEVGVVAYGPSGGVVVGGPNPAQIMEEIEPALVLLTHPEASVRAIPNGYVQLMLSPRVSLEQGRTLTARGSRQVRLIPSV
jgi:hypothetical protein